MKICSEFAKSYLFFGMSSYLIRLLCVDVCVCVCWLWAAPVFLLAFRSLGSFHYRWSFMDATILNAWQNWKREKCITWNMKSNPLRRIYVRRLQSVYENVDLYIVFRSRLYENMTEHLLYWSNVHWIENKHANDVAWWLADGGSSATAFATAKPNERTKKKYRNVFFLLVKVHLCCDMDSFCLCVCVCRGREALNCCIFM